MALQFYGRIESQRRNRKTIQNISDETRENRTGIGRDLTFFPAEPNSRIRRISGTKISQSG